MNIVIFIQIDSMIIICQVVKHVTENSLTILEDIFVLKEKTRQLEHKKSIHYHSTRSRSLNKILGKAQLSFIYTILWTLLTLTRKPNLKIQHCKVCHCTPLCISSIYHSSSGSEWNSSMLACSLHLPSSRHSSRNFFIKILCISCLPFELHIQPIITSLI